MCSTTERKGGSIRIGSKFFTSLLLLAALEPHQDDKTLADIPPDLIIAGDEHRCDPNKLQLPSTNQSIVYMAR
jgi:hypothetical protein